MHQQVPGAPLKLPPDRARGLHTQPPPGVTRQETGGRAERRSGQASQVAETPRKSSTATIIKSHTHNYSLRQELPVVSLTESTRRPGLVAPSSPSHTDALPLTTPTSSLCYPQQFFSPTAPPHHIHQSKRSSDREATPRWLPRVGPSTSWRLAPCLPTEHAVLRGRCLFPGCLGSARVDRSGFPHYGYGQRSTAAKTAARASACHPRRSAGRRRHQAPPGRAGLSLAAPAAGISPAQRHHAGGAASLGSLVPTDLLPKFPPRA